MLSIIIPVYNEKNTVQTIVQRIKDINIAKEIVIVDDGSQDGTREILKTITSNEVKILFHDRNFGKGHAIRTGLNVATGDIIIIQDADLEYDPRDYNRLIEPIISGKAQVVYGSRWLHKDIKQLPLNLFRLGRWLLTKLTNVLYHTAITDEPCGYKVFKADVIKNIPLECEKFEFCPEITAKVSRKGYVIYEVPINYYPRSIKEGKKISYIDGWQAIVTLFKYRFWK